MLYYFSVQSQMGCEKSVQKVNHNIQILCGLEMKIYQQISTIFLPGKSNVEYFWSFLVQFLL